MARNVRERQVLSGPRPHRHLGHAHAEAGDDLGGDRSDLDLSSELLRELVRLFVCLAGEVRVDDEQPDDHRDHDDRGDRQQDDAGALHGAQT